MGDCTTPSEATSAYDGKLRLLYFSNEFPNDDLPSLLRHLHNYSKDKEHQFLARLFDEATRAVRDEVRHLPVELSKLVPSFESIINLAEDVELRKSRLCGSIDGILLCVLQLATFLG